MLTAQTADGLCTLFVIYFWISSILTENATSNGGLDCALIKCYNLGNVVELDQQCVCQCLPGFFGILCEQVMKESRWPVGPYALLKPATGCPEKEAYGWSLGYINITTQHPMNLWIDRSESITSVPLSETATKLAGPFGNYSLQLNFCFKHENWPTQSATFWPTKSASVFGVLNGCPEGMVEEERMISLPRFESWWSDGYLPHFEFHLTDNVTEFLIKRCLINGTGHIRASYYTRPFMFTKEPGINCTDIEWTEVEEETITLKNEIDHKYTEMTFCIYTPYAFVPYKPSFIYTQDGFFPNPHIFKELETSQAIYLTVKCRKQLGVTDGTIDDYQITASSWDDTNAPYMARMSDIGWCPAVDDHNPFLQIDLFTISLIAGIKLFHRVNYIHSMEGNVYYRRWIPEGCRSFMVSHGIHPGNFTNYTESPFIVDSSQVFEEPHTFMFLRPFLARYIRIHPMEPIYGGRLCLRIELLGCHSTAKLTPLCGNVSEPFWVPLSTANPSSLLSSIATSSGNMSSLNDCKQACEELRGDCRAIQYITNMTCDLYTSPFPNTTLATRSEQQSSNELLVCLKEPLIAEYINLEKDTEAQLQMLDSSVLTSIGYPLYYRSNSVFKWTVTSARGFIRLTFVVIDFHIQSNTLNTGCSEDTLKFDEAFEPITPSHNGLTPTFPTEESILEIVFHTCQRSYQRSDRRKGFRVILESEVLSTTWYYWTDPGPLNGNLMSYSLLGFMDQVSRLQTWSIGSSNGGIGPYIMTFWYFNVPCDDGSYLIIHDAVTIHETKLCNTQMKPKKEYRTWYLQIDFAYTPNEDLREEIGFGAYFERTHINEFPHWLTRADVATTLLDGLTTQRRKVYYVCSKQVNKCYIYSRLSEFTDWLSHAKQCNELGYHQPVIHNRKEMEYLQAWLLYMEEDHLDDVSRYPPNIYTHIGLVRYKDGWRLQHVWNDGTLLTFSAWGSGEPSNVIINHCTGMTINMTTGRGSWVTVPCSSIPSSRVSRTFVSVCEKPFLPMNHTGLSTNGDGTYLEPEYKELLFHCNSTEWAIYTTVCDGIKDCSDGSDELNCSLRSSSEGACLEDEFSCGNGACIHVGLVCDFIDDCSDGSDEYCDYHNCTTEEYTCSNGQCVPLHSRCDAIDDCYDRSDEYLCAFCNHAFPCGDFTCIPWSYVCNGIQDCGDNIDEQCFNPYNSRTCYEFWKFGYDKNVTLTDTPEFLSIECQFYLEDHTLKITSILDLTLDLWIAQTGSYESSYMFANNFKKHGETCTFEISEQCKYHVNKAASYMDPHYDGSYSFCQPSSVKISTDGDMFSIDETRGIISGMEIELVAFYAVLKRPITIDFETSVLKNISTKLGLAICTAEYVETGINCGNGKTVSADRRCLYFTRAGVIDGCLNFKHLENCEDFLCPSGYTKCPSSFCLAQHFVCDGKRQCPGGEDEEKCWCVGGDTYSLAFIYHGELDDDIKSDIFQFARQFYSKNVKLYAISYIDISSTLRVTLSRMHPYNEALNLAYEETFSTERTLIESEIIKRFEYGDDVKIISIELEDVSKRLLTDIFFNVSDIDYVYRVRVDKTIQQKANVMNTTMETHIVVKSFDILASIGSRLFPFLCKEASSTREKADFKCMSSTIYVPLNQTCDGISQCPFGDDEAICDFKCLQSCSCKPYIVHCQSSGIGENDLLDLDSTTRVLNISNTTVFEDGILTIKNQFPYLLKLYAKHSRLTSVKDMTFTNTPSLIHLDLSFNEISVLRKDTFFGLTLITILNLEGNILLSVIEPTAFRMFSRIEKLSITHTRVSEILPYTFSGLKLNTLDISDNKIHTMHASAFSNLKALEINFERNEVKDFDVDLFVGIQNLHTVRSPSYKFCCYKPSTVQNDHCWPHEDEFSSCEDLMRNSILQTLLWVIGAAALVANGATILYRLINGRQKVRKGFEMFVLNLAVSDFLMGIYLIIIAAADLNFRNKYMLNDDYWRNSVWCSIAGILATVSSEASVLLMCLITVDRILVIIFPFGQWGFNVRSSRIAVATTWVVSWIIALIPVIVQDYFQGSFYSTSGVCLAMPLTHRRPPGWLYSFIIFVALNFVAFILIAIGQFIIYIEIRKKFKRMEQFKSQRRNDISIARNLFLVLFTDFLCWFPIGVMAIMAYDGRIIPGDVYVWTAVLVLPINSALNPFLYTLSAIIGLKNSQKKTFSERKSTLTTVT